MFRLNTFGRLFVERDGRRITGAAAQPRRLALLALVAAAGDRGLTRDQLLGMLWPESDEERARKGLNQALYALRQELGTDEVLLGTREIQLNPDLVASDLAAFTAAVKAGQLERATAEYTGPFLDGFHLSEAPEFERWVEEERAALARDYATILQQLARRAAERADWPDAVEWWRKLAAQDPLNARVAVGLMEALVAVGDRSGALRHARVYEAILHQELEVPPDRAVLELAERIRRESGSAPAGAVTPPTQASPPVAGAPPVPPTPAPAEPQPRPPGPRHWRVAAGALLGLGLVAGALVRAPAREIRLGRTGRITADPGLELYPALSPDGRLVAYAAGPAGQMRIYVRQVAGGRAIAVAESLAGDQHWPRWSPDGTLLSFEMGHAIYVVPALGGAARVLVPDDVPPSEDGPGFLAWSPDGSRIAYAVDRSIYVRATEGGTATRISTLDQPHSLAWSPDGSRLAFVRVNAAFVYAPNAIGNIAPSSIWTIPVSGGDAVQVTDAAALNTSPVWMPDGRGLLFVSNRDGSRDVYRVKLGRSGRPGTVRRLTAGLQPHTIDLSRDGRILAYAGFAQYANIWSVPIAERSPEPAVEAQPVTRGHQSIEGMAISRDGRWLAFDSDRGGEQAIYRIPLSGGEPERLSADSGDHFMPSWSPDDREIAYYGFRGGRRRLFVLRIGGGPASPVAADSGDQRFPDWAPDGRHLVFHSDRSGRFELYLTERDSAGRWSAARRLTSEGGQDARWSPDGRAIAYLRDGEVWTLAPSGGPPRRVVAALPAAPRPLLAQWSPDGRTLYYKALDPAGRASFWAVPAEGGGSRLLARLDDPGRPSSRAEFATDGQRLYFTVAERESDIWQVRVGAN